MGDANGDGLGDLIVGGQLLEDERATVVFGSPGAASVDLDRPGPHGILLRGARCEALGAAVAAAGDVDGDGLADALVAAERVCAPAAYPTDAAYVVLGGPPAVVEAAAPGVRALRIAGEHVGALAGVGDQDGDGLDDVALVAGQSVYVVRGRREPGQIALRTLGDDGVRLHVPHPPRRGLGGLVAVPDVNGDGRPELAIGTPHAGFGGRSRAGAVVVAFSPLLR